MSESFWMVVYIETKLNRYFSNSWGIYNMKENGCIDNRKGYKWIMDIKIAITNLYLSIAVIVSSRRYIVRGLRVVVAIKPTRKSANVAIMYSQCWRSSRNSIESNERQRPPEIRSAYEYVISVPVIIVGLRINKTRKFCRLCFTRFFHYYAPFSPVNRIGI